MTDEQKAFSQNALAAKTQNTHQCDGCERQCKLDTAWQLDERLPKGIYYFPVIGYDRIDYYYDKDGDKYDVEAMRIKSKSEALNLAREIVKLCDHYQEKHR